MPCQNGVLDHALCGRLVDTPTRWIRTMKRREDRDLIIVYLAGRIGICICMENMYAVAIWMDCPCGGGCL